jgi:tetratricopeptide (TPR) repeat protein
LGYDLQGEERFKNPFTSLIKEVKSTSEAYSGKIKMTQDLDNLLGSLHSDKSRLAFLNSIYIPGNVDVAGKILTMGEDSSVIEKEMAHAKKTGDTDRFKDMARKNIDYYVAHDFDILLRDIVIKWQDPELADYAINQMTSKSEEDRKLEGPLQYAAEIAQSFGKEEVAKQNLERLLALQEKDSEYKFPAGDTLKKLGRFSEAIDKYVESTKGRCSGFMGNALRIARENVPERVEEIAQIGFDAYEPETGFESIYVECAEILGKTEEAEKTLVKQSKKVKVKDSPRFYAGVVESLVKLGKNKEAEDLVRRVVKNEERAKKSDTYYSFDRSEELARLYHAIGETDAVKNIYVERIETGIREGHHPSNTVNDINKAINLTGDKATFMEKRLLLHEEQGEYEQASKLARELGNSGLAESYRTMHQMTSELKPQSTQ